DVHADVRRVDVIEHGGRDGRRHGTHHDRRAGDGYDPRHGDRRQRNDSGDGDRSTRVDVPHRRDSGRVRAAGGARRGAAGGGALGARDHALARGRDRDAARERLRLGAARIAADDQRRRRVPERRRDRRPRRHARLGGAVRTAEGAPVEDTGGLGTAGSHWRERVFLGELMTGWIGPAPNPLSIVTVQSLADLGYTVTETGADIVSPVSLTGGSALYS